MLGYPKAKTINFTSRIRLIEEVTFKIGLIIKRHDARTCRVICLAGMWSHLGLEGVREQSGRGGKDLNVKFPICEL